jgi:hypothetical protein
VTAVVRPDPAAVVRCVDGFVPGWLANANSPVPVAYGMGGTRPRHDGPHVGVHCEAVGLVVNAWHPAVTGPLPIGPRGLGLVIGWGVPRPPAPGWLDDPGWEIRVIEGVALGVDAVLAHSTGRVCGACHPGREDRCQRPAGHQATPGWEWWGQHAAVGTVWDDPMAAAPGPNVPARHREPAA